MGDEITCDTRELEATVRLLLVKKLSFTQVLLEIVDGHLMTDVNDELVANNIMTAAHDANYSSLSLLCQCDAYHRILEAMMDYLKHNVYTLN